MSADLYTRYLSWLRDDGEPLSTEDWQNMRRELTTDVNLLSRVFAGQFVNELPLLIEEDPKRIKCLLQRFDALRREVILLTNGRTHHNDTENEEEPS